MQCCNRCGNTHIGSLIFAPPMFRFLFQQDVEQWQDENLCDKELAEIRSLPMIKPPMASLWSVLSMVNS